MVCLVCMVGNDYQRILDGVNHWADREAIESLYLVYDSKKDKYGFASRKNVEDLSAAVSSLVLKQRKIGCNPQDFGNIFCTFYRVLDTEVNGQNRRVLIDATSTTKEAYGATVTVALMFKNVRIYIVPPKERGWYVPSPEDPVFKEWFQKTRSIPGLAPVEIYLPGQRLEQPNKEERRILERLREHGGSSESLVALIRWCGERTDDPVTKNRFSRIVSRLERRGFVQTNVTPSGKRVSLTVFGGMFAQAAVTKLQAQAR